MEITFPSQAWARNEKNSPSLHLCLSLHWLFEGFVQKSFILCANITSLSLGTLGEISDKTFEKTYFNSGQGVQMRRSQQLQQQHRLHWDYQKVAVLQAADFSGWHKLIWEKDLLEKALSELRTIDSCALTSSLSLFWVTRPAASINYQLVFFNQ